MVENGENLVSMATVASNDAGDAKDLVHTLAHSKSEPVRYVEGTMTVALEVDGQLWTAARIATSSPTCWSGTRRNG
jgi:hypothetical protein